MVYLIFSCVIILINFTLFNLHAEKHQSLFEIMHQSGDLFCFQYIIFSCPFLLLRKFAVWKPLIFILGINLLTIFLKTLSKKKRGRLNIFCQRKIINKDEIVAAIFVLCCIPLIRITTEDIGTVSDQGAYFLHTIVLMEEKESQINKIGELGLSEAVDSGLRELQQDMTAYYYNKDEDSYYLFALGTWCVIPALFGKMFGVWKCMLGINYLWILMVFNMFYLCKKIARNAYGKYISLGIFASAPIVLYIGKAGLSEIVILWLVVLGLNNLLSQRDKAIYYGAVCIGLIGFIHISILLYLPIITLIFFMVAIDKKEKKWIICNTINLVMFVLSVWYDYKLSPVYVEKQYKNFTFNGLISYQILFAGLSMIFLGVAFLQYYLFIKDFKILSRFNTFYFEHFKWIVAVIFLIIICWSVYNAYNLCFTDNFAIPGEMDAGSWNLRSRYINTGWSALSYLNIINIARATGISGLIIFSIIPFCKWEISKRGKLFYLLELYGLIYYLVFKVDTPFNYYASRYFLPLVVPIMTVTLTSCIEKRSWTIYILMVSMLFYYHYWYAFPKGGPYIGQYKILQDVLEVIPREAVVCCDEESVTVNTRLTSNLRILNDNKVYNYKNYGEVMEYYENQNIYIISEKEMPIESEILLSDIYVSQYSFGNGKNGNYAMDVGTYEIPVCIQLCSGGNRKKTAD